MTPKCTPTLGVAFVWEFWMFTALVGKANKHQIGLSWHHRKVLKLRCLKCLHIVHLYLICMSYDQKKGQESNCRNPSLGLATKARACKGVGQERKLNSHISCSQECKRVWGNEHSHSQANSHFGSWNFGGFSNFQRMIVGVKTHWIEKFLISLEIFWNFDV
jgi:hypothetical protein